MHVTVKAPEVAGVIMSLRKITLSLAIKRRKSALAVGRDDGVTVRALIAAVRARGAKTVKVGHRSARVLTGKFPLHLPAPSVRFYRSVPGIHRLATRAIVHLSRTVPNSLHPTPNTNLKYFSLRRLVRALRRLGVKPRNAVLISVLEIGEVFGLISS